MNFLIIELSKLTSLTLCVASCICLTISSNRQQVFSVMLSPSIATAIEAIANIEDENWLNFESEFMLVTAKMVRMVDEEEERERERGSVDK